MFFLCDLSATALICPPYEIIGDHMKSAVDELVEAIRDLEARVKWLEKAR
jgi:hypothetical protein